MVGGHIIAGLTVVWLAAVLIAVVLRILTRQSPQKTSPLQDEFERLRQGFRFVVTMKGEEPSRELCVVLRRLYGKCAAVSALSRKVEAVTDRNDDGYPWKDVDASRNDLALQRSVNRDNTIQEFGHQIKCAKCGVTGPALTWSYFISPISTWEHLCGRAGWMVICDGCHSQVAFICDALN
jgi:hypothetical protein